MIRLPAPSPSPRARGFSFIEVMVALSMLLVGCMAILPLFVLGVQNLAHRRLETDLRRLRPEVLALAQEEVDASAGMPKGLDASGRKVYPLSLKGYDVRVEWIASPFRPDTTLWALAAIRKDQEVVHVLTPIALMRSFYDAEAAGPAPAATAKR